MIKFDMSILSKSNNLIQKILPKTFAKITMTISNLLYFRRFTNVYFKFELNCINIEFSTAIMPLKATFFKYFLLIGDNPLLY